MTRKYRRVDASPVSGMTALFRAAIPLSCKYWSIRCCSAALTGDSLRSLTSNPLVYHDEVSADRLPAVLIGAVCLSAVAVVSAVSAQFADSFVASRDNPAIAYSAG